MQKAEGRITKARKDEITKGDSGGAESSASLSCLFRVVVLSCFRDSAFDSRRLPERRLGHGVVADVADRIAVMYAGRIVESAPVHDIYKEPAHPYTRGLLDSIPRLDQKGQELYAIKGLPPNLMNIPPGCAFNPRCPMAQDVCRTDVPPLYEVNGEDSGRRSACHFWRECLDG
mgnify:CR=1 FL=1